MSIFKRKIDLEDQGNDFVEEEICFKVDLPTDPKIVINEKTKSISLEEGEAHVTDS